jgi:hypothetical protein
MRHARDTWLRHEVVASLLQDIDGQVLDVGGLPGRLGGRLDGRVTTANIEPPADVIFDGKRLPFADSSFEAVTSIQVLEHLPRAARAAHLAELLRVASRRVVACCPLALSSSPAFERDLAQWFAQVTRTSHRYLEQHAANGLPTKSELLALIAGAPKGWAVQLQVNGSRAAWTELLKRETLAHFNHRASDRVRYAWFRLRTPLDRDLRNPTGLDDHRGIILADAAPQRGSADRQTP